MPRRVSAAKDLEEFNDAFFKGNYSTENRDAAVRLRWPAPGMRHRIDKRPRFDTTRNRARIQAVIPGLNDKPHLRAQNDMVLVCAPRAKKHRFRYKRAS